MSASEPAASATRGRPSRQLASFNGLRALAALMVLAYHVGLAAGITRTGPLAPVLAQLKGGVGIFFVISGALLYLPCARAIRSSESLPDWRSYASRRAVRILPGYWVVLTVVALSPLGTGVLSANAWRFYGLAQVYDRSTLFAGLSVAWTLCVELSFYALLPLIALLAARLVSRRRGLSSSTQLLVIGALALATLILRLVMAGSLLDAVPGHSLELATALPGLMDWFALGMGLAVLAAEWEAGSGFASRVAWLARKPLLCWIAASVCWCAGVPAQRGDLFLTTYGLATHCAIGAAAALLVLPAVHPAAAERPRGPLRLMVRPTMTWLGTISYGIYLWHAPLLFAIRGPGLPTAPIGLPALCLLFVEAAAGAVVLGALSWYLVERPAQRLIRGTSGAGIRALAPPTHRWGKPRLLSGAQLRAPFGRSGG